MKKLWEFEESVQKVLIPIHLKKHGEIIGELTTPYSYIYTLAKGASASPNSLLIAKAPKIIGSVKEDEIQSRLIRLLAEINHTYRICHHSLIQRFGSIEIIHGVPFLISAKRHLTLRDAMEESPLSETDTLAIAVQLCRALEYCAEKGIKCHQDLKPENVFLDIVDLKFLGDRPYPFKYQAYLADLDMANAAALFNKPYGSRPYMAAEQYGGAAEQDAGQKDFSRVDIFALGVNIYEMLTGGIHPLGERTSDIWPQSSKGKKWEHEEPWKKWARGNAVIKNEFAIKNDVILGIMKKCLSAKVSDRPSPTQLKDDLFRELTILNPQAATNLDAYLNMLDSAERVNADEGWPYMDQLIDKVRHCFDEEDSK